MLLYVSELEVDKIYLIVRDLRCHASVLSELVSLVDIGIKGVRAKVLLKVRLDNARAILLHSPWAPWRSMRRSSGVSPGRDVDANTG